MHLSGLVYDRRWMFIDGARSRFISQRTHSLLALVQPTILFNGCGLASGLELNAPNKKSIIVPLLPPSPTNVLTVGIWETEVCNVVDQGDDISKWISSFLGQENIRLVYCDESSEMQKCESKYRVTNEDQTAFADGYPMLLISEESLADLNKRMEVPLPMTRFRPNIVVKGSGTPFSEDRWQEFRIDGVNGTITLKGVKCCSRCKLTTVDQVLFDLQVHF
jgi:uncharacterized protein YcbX